MNSQQIATDLIEYLKKNAASGLLPQELSLDFPLLESGALDSLGLFKLVAHIEDSLNVEIRPEEIVPANFATLQAVIDLVQGHSA